MNTSLSIHRVGGITVKRQVLGSKTHTLTLEMTSASVGDAASVMHEVTIFSDKPLELVEATAD